MGCCPVKYETPFTEAARVLKSTFPGVRDIEPLILIKGAYGFPFRCREHDVDVFAKVAHVRDYTRRTLQLLSTTRLKYTLTPLKYRVTASHVVALYPWIDGGDLMRQLSHYMPGTRKERLMRSLVRAVHELHSLGIAHRDIKLENVLVDRGECILIDTDTCDKASELYYTGTANYLPPRSTVCRVLEHPGIPRSDKIYWLDCYALGKVLAKILLVGSVDPQEQRIWNMWVDRERASPSAVRLLLTQRRTHPYWKLVYWWCVENQQELMNEYPYIKGLDEAMDALESGTRDK